MSTRTLPLAVVICLFAVACTPTSTGSSSTTIEETTTTAPSTSTSDGQGKSDGRGKSQSTQKELRPPTTGNPDDVASDAFWPAGDFEVAGDPTLFEEDALEAIERWLPEDLVEGRSWEVFSEGGDTSVLAVSVIPTLTWRGDPNFAPTLISILSEADATEISPGIYQTTTLGGLVLYAWSTGDGFIISSSADQDTAIRYLEMLASESQPQQVWEPGVCLYIDPDTETLPYAPFPPDIVVPCRGSHNAEVLLSRQVGTELTKFDTETIQYDRSYVCDEAYTKEFGPQKTHKPTLITYMPDEDEWDRGDRYLACVVQLETAEGVELFAGPMAELPNLDWNPEPGACFAMTFAPDVVECGGSHGYQYLGDADVTFDDWPTEGASAFEDACVDLLESFVQQGPTKVEVFTTGLFPYAFEQGDRSVRCIAFATEDSLLVPVLGSFDEVWQVISTGGTVA